MKKIFLHSIFFTVAIVTLIPMWLMFITSFKLGDSFLDLDGIFFSWDNLSFRNYIDVWVEGKFGRYFFNSVVVTFSITIANVIFDSMVAYALARRKFFGKNILMGIIFMKLMIPAAVLIVPTFIIVRELYLYDTYLALILPLIAETFGIFIIRQYILSLPIELEEAAQLEGASDWKIFISIILPLCKPVISVVIIHSVMTSWNMYIYPLILTSSDTMRTLPLGVAYYRVSQSGLDAGHLMAAAAVSSFPIIMCFVFSKKNNQCSCTRSYKRIKNDKENYFYKSFFYGANHAIR